MSKFKVGDRVIVNDFEFTNVHGEVVSHLESRRLYEVVLDGNKGVSQFYPDEMKLETPQQSLRSPEQKYIIIHENFGGSYHLCFNAEEVLSVISENDLCPGDYKVYKLGSEVKLSLEEIDEAK